MLCTRVLIYSLLICHIQERMFKYYSKTKVFMAFGPGRCFLSGGLILCQKNLDYSIFEQKPPCKPRLIHESKVGP